MILKLPVRALTVATVLTLGTAFGVTGCAAGSAESSSTQADSSTAASASSASASTSASASDTASASASGSSAAIATAEGFDISKHSLTKDGSLWQIVNKTHPFQDKQFVPSGLVTTSSTNGKQMRKVAATALATMIKDSRAAGATVRVISAYRSYTYQKSLYAGYAAKHGKSDADTFSARAGYSDHQTGLATDLGQSSAGCDLDQCFGKTKAGKWLAKNAWKYGFVLRFPKGQQKITGYVYEPWHYRYIGKSAAKAFYNSKAKSLETFFGVSGGMSYKN